MDWLEFFDHLDLFLKFLRNPINIDCIIQNQSYYTTGLSEKTRVDLRIFFKYANFRKNIFFINIKVYSVFVMQIFINNLFQST